VEGGRSERIFRLKYVMQKKEQLQLSFVFPIIKLYFRKSNYDSSHIKKISCKTFEKDSFQFEMSVVLACSEKKCCIKRRFFCGWPVKFFILENLGELEN